ncbi:Rieske (2Fe-2S) protein [Streptomyces virginiae]|uniref:Rieske (2Fe-2S) protein n=1 Tax=Streptomyces TaxID=1883 RepID=UPI0005263AD3|nr:MULTISPECIES: Rieske (2Fe-2S) protein [Streptomyces]MCX4722185.1 Rieske (2Fe-2S) protein [Streptomyces virginiae]MCX5270520.1 Rieske (2Fe-2S) protein [Streptomyces virginiae]MYV75691.1 Rieske 2Fe-2S domain-containing protein [Streptomyces sp. SID1046]WSC76885.1 Rieske (2Fe-2S) protein [Streptomyces virginiae]
MSDLTHTARRTVLTIGAATLAGGAITACGGGSAEKASPGEPNNDTGVQPAAPAPATPDAGTAGKALTKKADVPVGGGKVFKEEKVVVTQPKAGTFKCFTAVCPHQGCLVNKVEDGSIDCPCHNSKFAIADGAVTKGPATKGLAEKKIKVAADGNISLA